MLPRFRTLLFLIFLFVGCSISAQPSIPIKRVKLEHIGIEQGLSQGLVNYILQDHRGFMWFATKDGLNRYDGYRFKVYRHQLKDSNSLSDNNIFALSIDKRGLIWITYWDRNVDVFNPETEKTFRLGNALNQLRLSNSSFASFYAIQLASGSVILTDAHHWIWVDVSEKRDSKGFGYSLSVENHSRYLPFGPPKNPGWFSYYVTQNQNLHLSSGDSVWVYAHADLKRKPSFRKLHYTHFVSKRPVSTEPNVANEPLQILNEDTVHHRLCMRLWLSGIYFIYDQEKEKVITTCHQGRNFLGTTNFGPDGQVWIASLNGLLKWNLTTHLVELIRSKNPEIGDEQLTQSGAYFDKSGQIWMGSYGYGIFKFNPKDDRFHHATVLPSGGFSINEMVEDKATNQLWLLNQNRLYRYDLKTGSIKGKPKYGPTKGDNVLTWYAGNADSLFHSNAFFSDGQVYWYMINSQLHCLDKDFNILKTWYRKDEIGRSGRFAMYRKGQVWMATNSSKVELYRFDGHGKPGMRQMPSIHVPTGSGLPFLSAMEFDESDILWLATTGGLLRFDPINETWHVFKPEEKNPESLPDDVLLSICQDPVLKDILWIGTNGNGLVKFDKRTGKCQTFHSKNTDIPNDVVYGVLDDKKGNLWLSTNQGLVRFNPKTLAVKVFTQKDGLQGNEFNRYASCKLSDGRLAFGGINGINVFDPAEIKDNDFRPKVFFTGFKIGNKTVWGDSSQQILNKEIFATKEVHLDYTQNFLTFQYASTDYANPATNRFQYQLIGLDKDWQPATTLNEATYTNLDPGEYTFRIKAANSDGIWSRHEASLQIFISAPWWATWWFRTFTVLSFGGMLYGFYRYRLAQELKIIRLRDKIALDLHDEIGSTLSSISLFGEAAKRMLPEDHKVNQVLNRINSDTKNMMESMGDIVWSINSRNDRFDNLVNRIRGFVIEVMEAKGATVDFQFSENLEKVDLNMEQRKNLFLLVKEAVNNAAKYSDCDDLKVILTYSQHQIHLVIEDNGKGFDVDEVQSGNGLLNIKKRANDLKASLKIESYLGKGTRVEVGFGV